MKTPWNDGWDFQAVPGEGPWVAVRIPHTTVELPYGDFSEAGYQRTTRYRKAFHPDPAFRGYRAWLTLEAAMARAVVSLNGQRLTEHCGGYTAFRCDLTEALDWERENLLTVDLDASEDPEIPPFGHVIDYLTYGGLYREVTWEWVPAVAMESLFVRTPETQGPHPRFECDVFLENPTQVRGDGSLTWSLGGPGIGPVGGTSPFVLTGESRQTVAFSSPVPGARPWDLDSPQLYTLAVEMAGPGGQRHRTSVRFGFRQARFCPEGFFLNGRRVELRGLNRHQSFPYVGYALPRSAQYKDAEILKFDLGVNLVRSSHYPPSRHFLDRCDEVGLLVFTELPGWQHIGGDRWKDRAVDSVGEMVRQAWNHPSVVLWGVRINESPDDDGLYARTNALARSLDPTRQTAGVRDFGGSRLLEDVYTFNDFSHDRGGEVLRKPEKIAGKGVPYLVTEFNGHMFPTKRFDPEPRRTEHALRHLRVLNEAAGNPAIAGALGWCFADYHTHKDCGSGDRICYHGVLDAFRIPKTAAGAYASQREGKPYLEVASAMVPGDHDQADLPPVVVLTNADFVEVSRNGEAIGRYFPDRKTFPHLPHPPVVIDDFIGNRIETNERFSPRDARRVKAVLLAVLKYGEDHLPLRYLATMGWLLVKYRMTYGQAADLFSRYVGNWGQKLLVWEFTAWKDGRPVLTARSGPHDENRLEVRADALELTEGDTWDCTRVVVRHLDENGRVLPYSNEALVIGTEGPGEVIGPRTFALVGGARAFWVKTTGTPGTVRLTVRSERAPVLTLELNVRKEARP